jgi:predicted esterase YcpF (UPF0227 family)
LWWEYFDHTNIKERKHQTARSTCSKALLEVLNRKENVLDLQTFTHFFAKNKNTLIKIGDHIVLPIFPYLLQWKM